MHAQVAHDLDGRCVLSVYVDNEPGVPTLEPEGGHMYMGIPFKVQTQTLPFTKACVPPFLQFLHHFASEINSDLYSITHL